MVSAGDGQRGRTRYDSRAEKSRSRGSGRDLYCKNIRSVGADVHGAQAHATAGFDPALLQAAVQAGVDIDAAEADADGGTPAISRSPVMMAVVEAAGGSGRCSGNGERSGGDQSEGHLAKHFKYSPIDWREAVVAS